MTRPKTTVPPDPDSPAESVLYLRVSTARQVKTDELDPEGYSVPAQREAGRRKADELGAAVVAEFVDYGESARTDDRPEFRRMLRYLKERGSVRYVIVDKVNRFARNRRDDANALFEIRAAGAMLVSAKENIDDTPVGGLIHGILATIAEYESRNNATEVLKGMTRKAQVGGTPGRAPIGYRNVTRIVEDREVHTVEIDPERGPLIQWAFEAYASGEWTTIQLHEALVEKGLKCLPNGRAKTPGPIHRSIVSDILHNRYYLGYVTFRGVEYEGRHQPLISEQVFERVQALLKARHRAGEKQRVHHHYLKGSVFCGRCGSRLCITKAKGNGGEYLYFFCLGRHKGSRCPQRYVSVEKVEQAVERHYAARVRMPESVQQTIRAGLEAELDRQRRHAAPEARHQQARVKQLEEERRRLARGAITGAIPEDLVAEEQERIRQELAGAKRVLEASEAVFARIEEGLTLGLHLLSQWDQVYLQGGPLIRRRSNQAIFEKLLVEEDEVMEVEYKEPWRTFFDQQFQTWMVQSTQNPASLSESQGLKKELLVPPVSLLSNLEPGSKTEVMVGPGGIEPPSLGL